MAKKGPLKKPKRKQKAPAACNYSELKTIAACYQRPSPAKSDHGNSTILQPLEGTGHAEMARYVKQITGQLCRYACLLGSRAKPVNRQYGFTNQGGRVTTSSSRPYANGWPPALPSASTGSGIKAGTF